MGRKEFKGGDKLASSITSTTSTAAGNLIMKHGSRGSLLSNAHQNTKISRDVEMEYSGTTKVVNSNHSATNAFWNTTASPPQLMKGKNMSSHPSSSSSSLLSGTDFSLNSTAGTTATTPNTTTPSTDTITSSPKKGWSLNIFGSSPRITRRKTGEEDIETLRHEFTLSSSIEGDNNNSTYTGPRLNAGSFGEADSESEAVSNGKRSRPLSGLVSFFIGSSSSSSSSSSSNQAASTASRPLRKARPSLILNSPSTTTVPQASSSMSPTNLMETSSPLNSINYSSNSSSSSSSSSSNNNNNNNNHARYAASMKTSSNCNVNSTLSDITQIEPHLYLGSMNAVRNVERIKNLGIIAVVDCSHTGDDVNHFGSETPSLDGIAKVYRFDMRDRSTEEASCNFYNAIEIIEQCRKAGAAALFHCVKGASRSVAFVIAYQMWYHRIGFEEAFTSVKALRGCADPNPSFIFQLYSWGQSRPTRPLLPRPSSSDDSNSSSSISCSNSFSHYNVSDDVGSQQIRYFYEVKTAREGALNIGLPCIYGPISQFEALKIIETTTTTTTHAPNVVVERCLFVYCPDTFYIWVPTQLLSEKLAAIASHAAEQLHAFENLAQFSSCKIISKGNEPKEFCMIFSTQG